jgi:hypothetical protein
MQFTPKSTSQICYYGLYLILKISNITQHVHRSSQYMEYFKFEMGFKTLNEKPIISENS